MWDLHNNLRIVRSISPVAVGTTGTGQTGKIVDRAGYDAVEFEIGYGSITATAATFSVVLKEGDTTGAMTSIADADLFGSESNVGIAAGTPRTSGSNKNVTKRVGYRGKKRYVQVSKLSSTATAGTPVYASVILGRPRNAPVAT